MLEWAVLLLTIAFVLNWVQLKPKNFPPGPPAVPILGSIPFIESKNFHLYLEKIRPKYGPVIGFKFGPTTDAVAICGFEEVKDALKREEFSGRPLSIVKLRNAEGVMFANGEHWKDQRRFALRHLRDFGFGTRLVSDLVADEVDEFCKVKLAGQSIIQVNGLFNTSAINIIWAMIAGTRNSYEDKNFDELLDLLNKLFRHGNVTGGINNFPLVKKIVSVFYEFEDDFIGRKLDEFFGRTIDEHRRTKTGTPRDLLDVYLSEMDSSAKKESFSEKTLKEVCRDLFAAGTESSSNTVSFAIMYLLIHPEWQDKLYAEIKENVGNSAPRIEDRARLPKVESFLAEVLRCNTIAPINIPRTALRDTTLGGYTIRQGTFVLMSIWSVLQDKSHWGDPHSFRPERHLSKEGEFVKDPYMLLFGGGARVCLGENLARNFVFLFFVSLIQRYRFSLPKGDSEPSTICEQGFTTAPRPFRAEIQPR